MTITQLPEPSSRHDTCAWCDRTFASIVDLLDHVDIRHLEPAPAGSSPSPRRLAA